MGLPPLAALLLSLSPAPAIPPAQAVVAQDDQTLVALFDADQAIRKAVSATKPIDVALARRMVAEDADRRIKARALLADGHVRTAEDFYRAAFILQHGTKAPDYLLAHSLALAAAARGKVEAQWIAAATLDRYLMATGQPQIYGTQYVRDTRNGATGLTMEPYDPSLVPDTLRTALGVPTRAEQQARLAAD